MQEIGIHFYEHRLFCLYTEVSENSRAIYINMKTVRHIFSLLEVGYLEKYDFELFEW